MPAELMSGSARRLAEELDEDGIKLEDDDAVRELLLDELDYARRIPMFEGRRPLYVVTARALGDESHNAQENDDRSEHGSLRHEEEDSCLR